MKCCSGKRAWIGLGAVAAGLLAVSARPGWVALPVLAGLACLVSMLFIMRRRRHPAGSLMGSPASDAGTSEDARAAELVRLRREIRQLRAPAGEESPVAASADPARRRDSAAGG
jgi:hypothetical protein